MKKISIFGIDIVTTDKIGDVAQLARALDWQSRGRGFESHLLHKDIFFKCQTILSGILILKNITNTYIRQVYVLITSL